MGGYEWGEIGSEGRSVPSYPQIDPEMDVDIRVGALHRVDWASSDAATTLGSRWAEPRPGRTSQSGLWAVFV